MKKNKYKLFINDLIRNNKKLLAHDKKVLKIINLIHKKIKDKGKVFIAGNGGSAAHAQHMAAEFLVRLNPKINRKPIPAIALALDTSTITACGNDYSFGNIFSRNLEALGDVNDILICLSTSGNSKNIINVLKKAKKLNIISLSFLGNNGGEAKKFSDVSLIINSSNTARIQEMHFSLLHYVFNEVEAKFLKK